MNVDRRRFLASTAALSSGAWLATGSEADPAPTAPMEKTRDFPISLAQWSCHVMLQAGKLDNLDWPEFTRTKFDINALEWVNSFFAEKKGNLGIQPKNAAYIQEMKQRCDDQGMESLIIMCDRTGGKMSSPELKQRQLAVDSHQAWLEVAKELGCHGIRVNAGSNGTLTREEHSKWCADGLARLSEEAAKLELNVLLENHGGSSSYAPWVVEVMHRVGLDNCGTLPDFGNFFICRKREGEDPKIYEQKKAKFEKENPRLAATCVEGDFGFSYDNYEGVRAMMLFAKGVSAKARDFGKDGEERSTDYLRMMQIVKDSGYQGHVGIEFEDKGIGISEEEGIKKTKALLERVIAQL